MAVIVFSVFDPCHKRIMSYINIIKLYKWYNIGKAVKAPCCWRISAQLTSYVVHLGYLYNLWPFEIPILLLHSQFEL